MEHYSIGGNTSNNKSSYGPMERQYVHISALNLVPIGQWFLLPVSLFVFGMGSLLTIVASTGEFRGPIRNGGCVLCLIVGILLVYISSKHVIRFCNIKKYNLFKQAYFVENRKNGVVCITDGKKTGLFNKNTCKIVVPLEYNELFWNFKLNIFEGNKGEQHYYIDTKGHAWIYNI